MVRTWSFVPGLRGGGLRTLDHEWTKNQGPGTDEERGTNNQGLIRYM